MRYDFWLICAIILVSLILGLTINQPLLCICIACMGIISWQVYRLHVLHQWIKQPKKHPIMSASGQLELLHRDIYQKIIKNKERKKKFSLFLTHFRQAVSALPNAIILLSNEGKIEWANEQAGRILGVFWPADSNIRIDNLLRHTEFEKLLIQENPDSSIEYNPKNNPNATIQIKIIRYSNDNRVLIANDVSQQVQANKTQSDFVANVSHELKTPLTVLKGYLEIMQSQDTLPENLRKPIQQMNAQTIRMQNIVHDLLFLAKLENPLDTPHNDTINTKNIVQNILETLQTEIHAKKLNIETNIDTKLTILGNETELHTAFFNIVLNAVNYTPSEGKISIRWHQQDHTISFSVSDNGDGIAASEIHRLTQRFYRADNDRSRETGGTGLGLAIVKHVLQRHNAVLDIKSTLNQGSTFHCLFPAQ